MIRKIFFLFLIFSCSSSHESDTDLINNNGNTDPQDYDEIEYGVNEYQVTFQGLERDFIVYIPESYDHQNPSPILFVFHGFGGSNDFIMSNSGFNIISEQENFIVVYPKGSDFWGVPHWNVGGWTNSSTTDDVSFVNFLIDLISYEYNTDQNRLYATGMSNGGFFSFLLACQMSDKFAAIASVTGSMTPETFLNCDPQKEVPILQIHGTEDPLVTYDGGINTGNFLNQDWSLGIEEVLDYWVQTNYCSPNPTSVLLNDSNPNDNFWVERITFEDGYRGSVVDHYKVYGGEHNWFNNQDINSSELIWEFFSNHDINGYID